MRHSDGIEEEKDVFYLWYVARRWCVMSLPDRVIVD